ncbi:MAG: NDP-hexose 4-ketoreductase [Chloroflexota bacterium]|nr:MAG: NDP-hexose 4-ketoreductase [Chloroflexota bacterium]HDD62749.1 ATP-dependent Clp protease ATP-binding subunit [Chloroflexota bacterium]
MERFTQRARRVLSLAHKEAERMKHAQIGTEHLLMGLLLDQGGIAGQVLRDLGLDIDSVLTITESITGFGEYSGDALALSRGTQRVLELAVEEARNLSHHYIGVEHILLGLVTYSKGVANDILEQLGLSAEQIRRQTLREIENQKDKGKTQRERRQIGKPKRAKAKSKTPMVDQLAVNLTDLAEDGKLDPVIGREKEIERVVQILARRTKNNPALIGEPGVGKTAIVEGLTQRIADGEVPAPLLGKRVLQLDLGSVVAGTMYRGQFEERMKRVISELKQSDAILFIDEVHMLVGAGSAGSAMDAANILKPALSRGELQVVGATTLDEYRKHIESDAALERRFQPITVDEPTQEETIEILQGIRPAYEDHHQLKISDEALKAATDLSARYVSDRFLPDKAIDLIDEASSRVRMFKNPIGDEAKEVVHKLRTVRKEMKASDEGQAQFTDLQTLQRSLEEKLEELKAAWDRDSSPTVTTEDIAEIVSMWTGIPVMELAEEESDRLMHMEEELHKHIIGQDEAIEKISKSVRRSRAGLKDPKRPVGSFIFLGPTGVGKTELTKALAKFMFGSEDALIHLDMSEFMERHSVSRLVGAPPGYIGYDDAGQLTEAIRRRPYSIVVFDEIEKAHQDAHNMLLQIMEEGHITDARGRTVDFRNALIIMTSNIGAELIQNNASIGFDLASDEEQSRKRDYEDMRRKLLKSLKHTFRPEFINRVDSVVVFHALSKDHIREIVNLELNKVRERLVEKNLQLEITPEGIEMLVKMGYNPEMGARPLRRVIQEKIENQLSDAVLSGQFSSGDIVLVEAALGEDEDEDEGEIILTKGDPKIYGKPFLTEEEDEPVAVG